MANDIWYTIRKNRIKQGFVEGFEIDDEMAQAILQADEMRTEKTAQKVE